MPIEAPCAHWWRVLEFVTCHAGLKNATKQYILTHGRRAPFIPNSVSVKGYSRFTYYRLALHLETQSQTFPYSMYTFAQVVRPQLSLFYLAVLSQVDGVVAERHALCVLRSSWSWLYSWRMRGPAVHGAWWRMLLWQISSSWLGCHRAGAADASMEFENDFDLQRHDKAAYAIAASRHPIDDGRLYLLVSFHSLANSVLWFC